MFKVPGERKSSYDPNGDVTIALLNDTESGIDAKWIDYAGEAVRYGGCGPGQVFAQSTNSEHPWLLSQSATGMELACICFTGSGDIKLSEVLQTLAASVGKEVKAGYLNGGGDFRAEVSAREAERLVLANPGKTMGYTFRNDNPDCCWVKVHGTGFSKSDEWTTVVYSTGGGTASQTRRRRRAKRHNVCEATTMDDVCTQCKWTACGESVCCEALGKEYEAHNINGLRFFIEKGCLDAFPKLHDQISGDVAEICRLLPEKAVGVLREKTAVWINGVLRYPGEDRPRHGAWCHWGPGFPSSKGDLPEKGGCVEVCQCSHYLDWVWSQPAMLLHELAHAYHCHREGEVDGIIRRAYGEAMASGRYATGEVMGEAQSQRPYGATNHAEFFAESSEAFFSSRRFRNDFFPYVHAELRGFDPVAYKMCEDVWGVLGEELPSRAEVPESWLRSLAKLDQQEARRRFEDADKDGSGTLDAAEFSAVVSALAPGIGSEEARAVFLFADANRDGAVAYGEFLAWLTSHSASYVKNA
mmetsp:Transcript_74991/g.223482  ORF Transcript_74991/g.223482 Transcript_74991/m.223482 type:complete len:527 (+) Transcript_74991:61-1641(+)